MRTPLPARAPLGIFLVLVFLAGSVASMAERRANPVYEPPFPALTDEEQRGWEAISPGLQGSFASIDVRYPHGAVPELSKRARHWKGTAWRGERLHSQIALWSRDSVGQVRLSAGPLRAADGKTLGADAVQLRFARYVLAEGKPTADILDTARALDIPERSARPVWVSIDVPKDSAPGLYTSRVSAQGKGNAPLSFDIEVEVLPLVLPAPSEWHFHLDLWQNPYAVARYHHVEPWSPEHFKLLEPHLRMLAESGQKCLTTSIVYRPWGTQTYDPYDSMVQWSRTLGGKWKYDYAIFDRYVEFGAKCGLDRMISCFSVAPWGSTVRYLDEATGAYVDASAPPGKPEFDEIWRPFLTDFRKHLRRKGWLNRVQIAMDELPLPIVQSVSKLIYETAPELKLAVAGGNEPEIGKLTHDWCVFIAPNPVTPEAARERAKRGRKTTFYVCCGPDRPNTFTFSPPAEAAWMGLYAASRDYSGFLRWAYDSWTEDPLYDTNHVTWYAGDCFLVYPNARSSIRFERLREGIQGYEKVLILRDLARRSKREDAKSAAAEMEGALAKLSYDAANKAPAGEFVGPAEAAIEKLSRAVAKETP